MQPEKGTHRELNQPGLIQAWTREKAAWIKHRSTEIDLTRKGTHRELNQPGLIQPSTREKAAWIKHKSTAVNSTINCSWFQIDLQLNQAEINHGWFNEKKVPTISVFKAL